MSDDDNTATSLLDQPRHRQDEDALKLGPRKRPCFTDPLVHYGRHFGRTEHAMCSIRTLLKNGLPSIDQIPDFVGRSPPDDSRPEREIRVLYSLLRMVPNLRSRILASSEEEVQSIADLVQKGISSARSDDTKSLKSVIIDWITPPGQSLIPPLSRTNKSDRGFRHDRTGYLLCPAGLDWADQDIRAGLCGGHLQVSGDQWPLFLYQELSYDPEDPWRGLFRSNLIVSAYKHIFTSPSSVGKEPKATRSGNARIHNMIQVTSASIAYVATQVRFALCSSAVFSRTDTITDSERFYTSVLDLLEDPDESDEVNLLIEWWNRQIFPAHSLTQRAPARNTVLAKIRARRAAIKASAIHANSSAGAR